MTESHRDPPLGDGIGFSRFVPDESGLFVPASSKDHEAKSPRGIVRLALGGLADWVQAFAGLAMVVVTILSVAVAIVALIAQHQSDEERAAAERARTNAELSLSQEQLKTQQLQVKLQQLQIATNGAADRQTQLVIRQLIEQQRLAQQRGGPSPTGQR